MKYLHSFLLLFLTVAFIACSDEDPNPYIGGGTGNSGTIGNLKDGVTKISDDSLGFVLYAPGKTSVYLIGDFNNWQISESYKMTKTGDRFCIRIGNLQKGKEYICQYLIDNSIRVADPYATKISDPENDKYISSAIYPNLISYPTGKTTEIAMVVNTDRTEYSWNVANFNVTNRENMVIYETLIRDFTDKGSIKGVQEKLSYLKELGVNAIELMPFNEFEGNDSWGYNPSFYFATDKAYGTPNDYKDFIDACHTNGIAVIMDMVLNHSFGQSPLVRMYMNGDKAAADNPWYNVESPNTVYSWGYDFNHKSTSTRAFVDSVCSYWMKEYKIDGFRFDFTKGFTNTAGNGWSYDLERINILKRMSDEIWKRKSDAIIILEHLTDNSEEKVLSDYGIYLWGNMNGNFNQATMGWENNNINWASYINRGWTKSNLVAYMESHDEERIMFKNRQWGNSNNPPYDVKDLNTGLKRTEAAAVLLMAIPGPKMIWQFEEMGYDFSINSRSDGYWEDTDQYNNGDYRLVKKPIKWDYLNISARKSLHDVYVKMIKLRNQNAIFSTNVYTIKEDDLYKQILLKSSSGNICAIANLNVTITSKSVNFGKTGEWEDYFTGETLNLTTTDQIIELQPGEYRLYISK